MANIMIIVKWCRVQIVIDVYTPSLASCSPATSMDNAMNPMPVAQQLKH